MTDVSPGPGWWLASDGHWYPPREAEEPPAPGWWLASDGKWYPPSDADEPPEPGWWLASDGKWYPPADADEPADGAVPPDPPTEPAHAAATPNGTPENGTAGSASDHDRGAHGRGHPVDRPLRSVEQAAAASGHGAGLPNDAAEQIRRRNAASREDAMTQFPARFLAASRAVALLESELGAATADASPHRNRPTRSARSAAKAEAAAARQVAEHATSASAPSPAVEADPPVEVEADPPGSFVFADDTDAAPAAVAPEPPPDPPPTVPVGRPTVRPDDADGWPAPKPAPRPTTRPDGVLLELRPSPLGAELDHVGDRLLVFGDRVELRDRADHVRQLLPSSEITDVVVQRKFTGAVLTIEAGAGESIVVKGLKPEQADEVRSLVHAHTRDADERRALDDTDDPPVGPSPSPSPSVTSPDAVANAANRLAILNRNRLNEADLLRKLADLHRAGVLSDTEFEDKVSLVGRLVSGEIIAIG